MPYKLAVSHDEIKAQAKSLGINVFCTVGDLKKALDQIPDDVNIWATGADIGGYDVSIQGYCTFDEQGDTLIFKHLEYTAYSHNDSLRALTDSLEFVD